MVKGPRNLDAKTFTEHADNSLNSATELLQVIKEAATNEERRHLELLLSLNMIEHAVLRVGQFLAEQNEQKRPSDAEPSAIETEDESILFLSPQGKDGPSCEIYPDGEGTFTIDFYDAEGGYQHSIDGNEPEELGAFIDYIPQPLGEALEEFLNKHHRKE